jgi:hypothetical protein
MWDLWWTKWHWYRFFSEFFGFALSVSFCRGSARSCIVWGMNNRPIRDRSSEIYSHPIKINQSDVMAIPAYGTKVSVESGKG